jgi:ubiquinol-cytochrome c reductase cytochrome b subunit
VRSIRYRPDWHKIVYAVFVAAFLVLGYYGTQPPSPAGNLVSQISTLIYFGFFALMPWWSRMGQFKTPPERVTYAHH